MLCLRRFLLATVTVLLAACAHTPPVPPAPPPQVSPAPAKEATPSPAPPVSTTPAPGLSYRPPAMAAPVKPVPDGSQLPAVQGLLAASERAARQGDLELAAANLERAQRLAPQSSQVYQRLAELRLRQRRPAEAEQLARKALAYAPQPAQQAQLWRQIAAARQQQGQIQSAQEALQRALTLEAKGGM